MITDISIIVAHDSNKLIGRGNSLPWHLPPDLQHFRRLTLGHAVIMGRKTYESLGRPLPDRTNIIVSTTLVNPIPGIMCCSSLTDALNYCTSSKVFIIGGRQIYEQSLHMCTNMYITRINNYYDGDTYFPDYDKGLFDTISCQNNNYNGVSFDYLHMSRR